MGTREEPATSLNSGKSQTRVLRVGIVVDVDYPHVGEVRPRRLARSLRSEGHQVSILSWNSRTRGAVEQTEECTVFRFGWFLQSKWFSLLSSTFPANPFWALWIRSVARREKLDCLVCSNLRLALATIVAAKMCGIGSI